jgi:ADP-heptose:LPS heptosyltransferase
MARLLDPLGIARRPLRYALDSAPLESRRRLLARALPSAPVAVLHAFASKRDRCVPLAEWLALARALAARGFAMLWLGSPRELDEVRAAAGTTAAGTTAAGAAAAWQYVDRVADGSLADAAAALSLARLFVGHDSGPMHVASALGVPTVGVFAPGEPSRTFPQGVAPSRVVAGATPDAISAELMLRAVDELAG